MTLFAGIVNLESFAPIAPAAAAELARAISRSPGDRPRLIEGPAYTFVKFDLCILGGEGVHVDDAGTVSLLAGVPLLSGRAGSSRHDELRALHEAWKRDDPSLMKGARGSYCTVHFDPVQRRVALVADKIGLRPIYYVVQGGHLYFSTVLRVLESLAAVEKRIDLKGLVEIVALGYPLGNRSAYEAVNVIGGGEVVEVRAAGARRLQYWRWDDLAESRLAAPELAAALFQTFQGAVRRRLQDGERAVVAFLSGGLDSRSTVSCLRSLGVQVHTLNFGPVGSQDLVLGKLAADELGTRHFEFPAGPVDFLDRMRSTHESWLKDPAAREIERPGLVWTGEGGSCGLGHIYLNREIVELIRAGRADEAVAAYLRYNGAGLAGRMFLAEYRPRVLGLPHAGVVEELSKLKSFDEGRRFHLFLMANGQRRMLARHFEDIDLRRFELVTPFFDAEFLQLILSTRVDAFLHHGFYMRWLEEHPPEALAVPWQAYPGHAPCPLPIPAGLRWQWREGWYSKDERRAQLIQTVTALESMLRDARFPVWLLDRKVLRLAAWLSRLNLGNYSYILKATSTIFRYASLAHQPNERGAAQE